MSTCYICKKPESLFTDKVGRGYCEDCLTTLPAPGNAEMIAALTATIPFAPGDRVEARTGAILFDGVGTVTDISFDIQHGGTPVYPAFRVVIDQKAYEDAPDDCYYTECCLTRVD